MAPGGLFHRRCGGRCRYDGSLAPAWRAYPEPFESGIVATGVPSLRFSVGFYLVAIFFVIFDIEAVFIFAWAIAFRESGWAGYSEISIFITVLVAALAYLWKLGALDWRTRRQKAVDVETGFWH